MLNVTDKWCLLGGARFCKMNDCGWFGWKHFISINLFFKKKVDVDLLYFYIFDYGDTKAQCILYICARSWNDLCTLGFLNMHIAYLQQSHWKLKACIASKSQICTLSFFWKEKKFKYQTIANNTFFVSGCFLISAPDVCFDAKVQFRQKIQKKNF